MAQTKRKIKPNTIDIARNAFLFGRCAPLRSPSYVERVTVKYLCAAHLIFTPVQLPPIHGLVTVWRDVKFSDLERPERQVDETQRAQPMREF